MIKSGQHFDSEYRWWSRRVEVQKSDIEMVILVKPVRDLVILDFEVPHLALYSGPEVEKILIRVGSCLADDHLISLCSGHHSDFAEFE